MLDKEEEAINRLYCGVVCQFCNLNTLLLHDMREEERERFESVKDKLKSSIDLLHLHYEDKEKYL